MEMNLETASKSCPASAQFPLAHVSSEIPVEKIEEIAHQTITIPEPQVCRICKDEGENGEGLEELGCRCRGELSRMHRSCFLEWFGIRMLVRDNYKCEVCNSMLAFETQMVVADAVADHESGGREILMKGLRSELGLRTFGSILNMERAGDYDELLQVVEVRPNAPVRLRDNYRDGDAGVSRDCHRN